jgi:leucyl aminopeptidase
VALGKWATGLFGTHERLVELVRRAGDASGEKAWPMPLWEHHRKAVKSEVAMLKNTSGRDAGASTAAAFLAAFAEDTPWVHLDIAGTAWATKPGGYQPRGATGVGVRLVVEALRALREAKL